MLSVEGSFGRGFDSHRLHQSNLCLNLVLLISYYQENEMPPRLIINADDFGLTRGINRAVEELHRAGVLTSATLMASGSAFEHAVAIAQRNAALGVGCHLAFVDGTPVSAPEAIPSLLGKDQQTFRRSYLDFVQALLSHRIRPEHIALEAQAQIGKLQRAGIAVSHIDTHKHTHLYPAVAAPVLAAARRCGVPALRYPFEPRWARAEGEGEVNLTRRLAQRSFDLFEPSIRRLIDSAGDEQTTDGTLGIALTGSLTAKTLRGLLSRMLQDAPDRLFELCCHPGYDDGDLRLQNTRLLHSREVEYAALLEVLPEYSRTPASADLIHYGSLGRPGQLPATGHPAAATHDEKVL